MPKFRSAFFSALFLISALPGAAATARVLTTAGEGIDGGIDYLIVCDSAFLPQAERLSQLRKRFSPQLARRTAITPMQNIYRMHPPTGLRWTSLRNYLKAEFKGDADLKHVVLLGDADFRDDHPKNLVPAFQQRIPSLTNWSWSDTALQFYDTLVTEDAYVDYFDTLANGDTLRLAYAIGRIPASTPAEADAYLDKLEAYESAYPYGPQAFTYGFLNDDDIQKGSHLDLDPITSMPKLHEAVWDAIPVKPFVRRVLTIESPITAEYTKPAAKDSLLAMLNSGPGRFYFIGHGSHNQLTDEKVFEVPQDLTRLARKPILPIMSFLACTTARIAESHTPSMGERLLFHPNGAIAVLGGSIPTYPHPNNTLFIDWSAAAAQGLTLGQAMAKAKASNYDSRNSAAYIVLGDPALSMHTPTFDLLPAVGSGAGRLTLSAAAGDSAYFQLVAIDSISYASVAASGNDYIGDGKYPRERLLAEGRAAVSASGTVTFTLPPAGDPKSVSVKAMVWNARGMRYGHFPLESLSSALRPVAARGNARPGYRMVLEGNRLMLEGNGRRVGLDGRAIADGHPRR